MISEVNDFIDYVADKRLIEYYKKTFSLSSTKEALIKHFNSFGWGYMEDGIVYSGECKRDYVTIKKGDEERIIGWDWIAQEVDRKLYKEVPDNPTIFDFM